MLILSADTAHPLYEAVQRHGIGVALAWVAVAVASYVLTGWVRTYALKKNVLDVANERSMHERPTPRGGGAAIAFVAILSVSGLGALGYIPWGTVAAIAVGGSILAVVGWIDDHISLRSSVRAGLQALAAVFAVVMLGGFPTLDFGFATLEVGLLGSILAVFGIVWAINLYNFMDGIDGLSSSEAVFVGGLGGVLLWMAGAPGLASVAWVLAASALGFLIWNWPPARIFMGDSGSTFLGFGFATLAVAGAREGATSVWLWVVLLGVFLVDATVTLLRRMARKARWTEPHRSHTFQRVSRLLRSHRKVTLSVWALNLGWLGPLAAAIILQPSLSLVFTLAALLPLIALAITCGAGQEGELERLPWSRKPDRAT